MRPASRSCTSSPPATLLHAQARARRIGEAAGDEQAQIGLCGEDRDRRLVRLGRDDHLGEDAGDRLGRRRVERAVDRDDAAIGGDRIAAERLVVGLREVCAGRRRRRDWRA